MRGSWQRQTALTNNVANAETPGYVRQEVNFESTLQSAVSEGESLDQVQFQTEAVPTVAGPNGNTISVDEEDAKVAQNGLDYQALTQIANTRNSIMRAAMGLN